MDILYNINPLVLGVIGGVFMSETFITLKNLYNLLCKSKEDRDDFVIEHILENEENILSFKKHVMEKTCQNLDRRSAKLDKLNKTIKSKLSDISSNINHRGNYEKQQCTYPTGIYPIVTGVEFHQQQKSDQFQKLFKEKKAWNMEDTYLCGSHPFTKLPFHCHPQTDKCPTRLRGSRYPVPSEGTHTLERNIFTRFR